MKELAARVLITGGAGFIGSYLAEYLLREGHEVSVLDDLSTGRLENIQHLQARSDFHITIGSVLDEGVVQKLVGAVDVVYHLAAAVGVRLVMERPVETIQTNVAGTEMVLKCAVRGRKRVVITSTSEVYGKNAKVPLSEDDDGILGPTTKSRWGYSCSKAIDEFLGLAYWREKELPVVILRYFNTVGPRQTGRYGMVVPRFVRQALDHAPITVYGDGTQSRSFTDVEDVVRATVALSLHPKAGGEVFNVGNGQEVTIRALAERVKVLSESPSPIIQVPYEQAYQPGYEDLQRRVPNIRKARALVGYEPRVGLDQILTRIIAHMRATGHA